MCDVFLCSDEGVGLCDDDKMLLESLGRNDNNNNDDIVVDRNNNTDKEIDAEKQKRPKTSKGEDVYVFAISPHCFE